LKNVAKRTWRPETKRGSKLKTTRSKITITTSTRQRYWWSQWSLVSSQRQTDRHCRSVSPVHNVTPTRNSAVAERPRHAARR